MARPAAGGASYGGETYQEFWDRMERKHQRSQRTRGSSRRRVAKRKPPRMRAGTYKGIVDDGTDLGAAAALVADEASRIAAGHGMPDTAASVSVSVSGDTAVVYSDAPAAYPNEVPGVRHPVYGPTASNPRPAWVTNKYRPFLGPAADAKATAAMQRYAKKVDRMLKKAGFE